MGLSVPQVIGGALAAATSAVALSFLGVAGTLIGAVVGSLVATIGAALYSHSLGVAAAQLRVVRVAGGPEATGAGDDSLAGAPRSDPDEAELAPTADVTAKRPERRRVRMVAGLALGVLLALAGITAFELIIGHPVSGSTTSGTTIGQAVGGAQRAEPSVTRPASPTTTKTPHSATATTATATSGASSTATPGGPGASAGPETGPASTGSPAGQTAPVGQPAG
ncbi:MAG: hypothetical protein WCG47_06730 [Dermatophilaceae bacterium]